MRRTASEIIRNLEVRVARLERDARNVVDRNIMPRGDEFSQRMRISRKAEEHLENLLKKKLESNIKAVYRRRGETAEIYFIELSGDEDPLAIRRDDSEATNRTNYSLPSSKGAIGIYFEDAQIGLDVRGTEETASEDSDGYETISYDDYSYFDDIFIKELSVIVPGYYGLNSRELSQAILKEIKSVDDLSITLDKRSRKRFTGI